MKKIRILTFLLASSMLFPLIAGCSSSNQTIDEEETTSSSSDQTTDVVKPGTEIPDTEVKDSDDGKTKVIYAVASDLGGAITGTLEQSLTDGSSTTVVKAVSDLGYTFKCWSDGKTEATRSGDTGEAGKTTTIYAVFEMDCQELPILCLNTETGKDVTSKEEYISGSISITNCDSEYVLEDVVTQVRGRGNFSWELEKKSYKIRLEESAALLGLGEGKSKSWALIANHCDQSLMRNYLSYQLCRELSGIAWAPDCTNVEVYLNGDYQGVYLLVETIKVDEHRIAINEDIESGTDIGYLLQMTRNSDEYYRFNVNGFNYDIKSDLSEKDDLAADQYAYIYDYVEKCWNAVQSGDQEEIASLIDLDSVIDTYLVEEFNKNLDVGYDSFFLYKDQGGKLTFGPIWDFDIAFGNSNEHDCEQTYNLYTAIDYCNHYHSNEWYTVLMEYKWFRQLVLERWNSEEVQTIFGNLSQLATDTGVAGYNSYCRNFTRWPILGQKINRETRYITSLTSYKEHYQYLANWIAERFTWLNENLELCLSQNTVTNDPPVVYSFSGGTGTQADPYLISTSADFETFTSALSGTDFEGVWFLQTSDLDLTTLSSYNGIGSSASFSGVYDGGGHTIHAVINSGDGCLFPYVSGLVMNLITTGSVTNSNQAAGICRSVRRGGALVNCASFMDITSTGGNAGGLSPSTQDGDSSMILNCYFGGSLSGESQNSPINCWLSGRGGIFRYLYYSQELKVTGSGLSVSEDDVALAEKDMTQNLAQLLNSHLTEVAQLLSSYGLSASDLCTWTSDGGYPTMRAK